MGLIRFNGPACAQATELVDDERFSGCVPDPKTSSHRRPTSVSTSPAVATKIDASGERSGQRARRPLCWGRRAQPNTSHQLPQGMQLHSLTLRLYVCAASARRWRHSWRRCVGRRTWCRKRTSRRERSASRPSSGSTASARGCSRACTTKCSRTPIRSPKSCRRVASFANPTLSVLRSSSFRLWLLFCGPAVSDPLHTSCPALTLTLTPRRTRSGSRRTRAWDWTAQNCRRCSTVWSRPNRAAAELESVYVSQRKAK